jgi:prevent-host-death family protein
MKTASVSELKANLSRYLRMAKRGSEVQILERGVPIARLVGLPGIAAEADQQRLDRLVRAGIVRRAAGDLGWLLQEPPIEGREARLSEAVGEDRVDRL